MHLFHSYADSKEKTELTSKILLKRSFIDSDSFYVESTNQSLNLPPRIKIRLNTLCHPSHNALSKYFFTLDTFPRIFMFVKKRNPDISAFFPIRIRIEQNIFFLDCICLYLLHVTLVLDLHFKKVS